MSELPDSPGLALAIEILLINKFESSIRDFFFSAVIRFCFEWKLMEKERDKWKKKERKHSKSNSNAATDVIFVTSKNKDFDPCCA